MTEHNLKEKTAKSLLWGGFGTGLQQVLGLAFGIVFARILNAEDYGLVGMLSIFTSIALAIQESGFTATLTNKKNTTHKEYNAVFWFSVLSSIAMYILLFLAAPYIADFYSEPRLTLLARVLFLSFLLSSIGITHNIILFKNLQVKERAKIEVTSLIVGGIVGIVLILFKLTYWGLAVQMISYLAVTTLLRWRYVNWRPTWNVDFSPLRGIFKESIFLLATNIFNHISVNVFAVFLGRFYPAAQVGYYTQGYKWMNLGSTTVRGMIFGVAQPVLVQVTDDEGRFKNVVRKMIRFGAFVSFPLMIGLILIAEELIVIAIGEKWLPSVPYLQLFCIWGAFSFLWVFYSQLLITRGKFRVYMYGVILTGLAHFALLFFLFSYGVYQMIMAYIATYFVSLAGWHYFIRKETGLRYREVAKDIFPYFGVALVACVAAYVITMRIENIYLLFLLKGGIMVAVYALILKLSNSVLFKESILFMQAYFNRKKNQSKK